MLQTWSAELARAAISEVDRRAVAASENARALVLERLDVSSEQRPGFAGSVDQDRDALNAWASLGRVLADAGASPSLAAYVVDALAAVASKSERDWVNASRGALIEAYVAAQRELVEVRIAQAWRFPRCVVRLDERTAAVAACFPDDDADATSRWADEVAAGLAKMGIRRVHAEGTPSARAALADALSVAGIDLARTPLAR